MPSDNTECNQSTSSERKIQNCKNKQTTRWQEGQLDESKKYLSEQCNGLQNPNLNFGSCKLSWKASKQSTASSKQLPNQASLVNMKKGKTRFNSYQQEVHQQPCIGYHFMLKVTISSAETTCNNNQLKTTFIGASELVPKCLGTCYSNRSTI